MKKVLKGILLAGLVTLIFSSCDTLYPSYELQVGNNCQKIETLFGIQVPTVKYDLIEVKVGDFTFSDIPMGEYSSNTETVKSGVEYEVSVTYQVYDWKVPDNSTDPMADGYWVEGGEETKTFDEPLTFASNLGHDKYSLDFSIGSIFSGYDIDYDRYYVDEEE